MILVPGLGPGTQCLRGSASRAVHFGLASLRLIRQSLKDSAFPGRDREREAAMRDAIQEFMAYNRPFARRGPELLRFKISRMAESPFAFFRGTFHLFARDVLDRTYEPLALISGSGPELDLVGDIHGENYGTFK